jgi:hypothetical protein
VLGLGTALWRNGLAETSWQKPVHTCEPTETPGASMVSGFLRFCLLRKTSVPSAGALGQHSYSDIDLGSPSATNPNQAAQKLPPTMQRNCISPWAPLLLLPLLLLAQSSSCVRAASTPYSLSAEADRVHFLPGGPAQLDFGLFSG